MPPQNMGLLGKWGGKFNTSGIVGAAAANLPDGRILLFSAAFKNTYADGDLGKTWTTIYNPFRDRMQNEELIKMGHDMFCPGTAVLRNGEIMITGGSSSFATTLYSPWKTTKWTRDPKQNLKIKRGYHSMTVLDDGSVFTIGGSWSGDNIEKDGEIWSPQTKSWKKLSGIPAEIIYVKDEQSFDYHPWLFHTPNGKILHVGPSTQMNWIDPKNNEYKRIGRRPGVDQMNGNALMYDIGKILILGGAENYYDGAIAVRTAYTIDVNNGDRIKIRRTGRLNRGRIFCNSVILPSGEVVVIGGRADASAFQDGPKSVLEAEIWNPQTGRFTLLSKMAVARNYHSVAILMKDGRVFVAGGGLCPTCADWGLNHPDAEIFTPPYLLDGEGKPAKRPKILRVSKRRIRLGDRILVSVDTNGPHTFSAIRVSAVTHSVNNDLRRIPLKGRQFGAKRWLVYIPRNKHVMIQGTYWLYAMNVGGVPSIGRTISI